MKPDKVLRVVPAKIAVFHAVRWDGKEPGEELRWMADEFGWRIKGVFPAMIRGRERDSLLIVGRSRKQYRALPGDWIVALGANGSIRVCSDSTFREDYREEAQ